MKKLPWLFLILVCTGIYNSCKDFDIQPELIDNSVRIKTIREVDKLGIEKSREVFFYTKNRLTFYKLYTLEKGELKEKQKVLISYDGDFAWTTISAKKNDQWTVLQECSYSLSNNLIIGKTVSRLKWPQCLNCWKYNYKYQGTKLQEWTKLIKDENEGWREYRKAEFIYDNNKLVEYKDYENYDNTELKLDYKKLYFNQNGKVAGWQGGTYIEGQEWEPVEKADYYYEGTNVIVKSFSVRIANTSNWKNLGTVNYNYNANGCLSEKITSSGSTTIYEYENGSGNTAQFYYNPEDHVVNEPGLKCARISKGSFHFFQE